MELKRSQKQSLTTDRVSLVLTATRCCRYPPRPTRVTFSCLSCCTLYASRMVQERYRERDERDYFMCMCAYLLNGSTGELRPVGERIRCGVEVSRRDCLSIWQIYVGVATVWRRGGYSRILQVYSSFVTETQTRSSRGGIGSSRLVSLVLLFMKFFVVDGNRSGWAQGGRGQHKVEWECDHHRHNHQAVRTASRWRGHRQWGSHRHYWVATLRWDVLNHQLD